MKTQLRFLCLILSMFGITLHAAAQGTAFTYQGQLQSGGGPASGTYNLTFSLFNASSGGTASVGPVTTNGVVVSNGLFEVTVDFGPGAFTGAPSWLQIGVESNGITSFTPLTPRQLIGPVPYAIFATTASNLSGTIPASQVVGTVAQSLSGTYNNAVTLNNAADSFTGTFNGNGGGLSNLPAWSLNGNAGTTSGNFLGTSDNQPLQLKVNGAQAGVISPSGGSPNVIFGPAQNTTGAGNLGTSILGGSNNTIGTVSSYANIGGGAGNSIQSGGDHSFIGGGLNNSIQAGADFSAVAGGDANIIGGTAPYSFIGGGTGDSISSGASLSVIGGGNENAIQANATESFLGGGFDNIIAVNNAVLGGGLGNQILSGGTSSVLVGGADNIIWSNANVSFLGGGYGNYLRNNSSYSVLTGGYANIVSNNFDSLGGGYVNKVEADYATVPGGASNVAGGKYSLAAGQQAQAANQGAFVWADSQNAAFASTNNDSFNVRAQGGVNLVTGGAGLNLDGQHLVGGGVLTNGESGVSLGNLSLNDLTLSGSMNVPYPFSISAAVTFLRSSPFFYMGNNSMYMGLNSGSGNNGDYNVVFGDNSMGYNTTGSENTALGHAALLGNSTGSQNTAIGISALQANSVGEENTAVGASALLSEISGGGDTATGAYSLQANTIGGYNSAFGFQSLFGNTTGGGNTALGTFAMFGSTTGSNNVAVGVSALSGSQNATAEVAVGYQALQNDSSGFGDNTAIGYNALNGNTIGNGNTALGSAALVSNASGSDNVAVGTVALTSNQQGGENTAVGSTALNRSTGTGNTAIGFGAGLALTQGDFNIMIGWVAGANLSSGESDIYIGNGGQVNESNVIRIGDPVNQTQTYIAGKLNGDGSGLTGVVAASLATPPGMAAIPGGGFIIGDTVDNEGDAIPNVVTLSTFYMDVNEVTYPVWQSVYFWATNNGYTFDNSGGSFNQWGDYAGFNKPVSGVNWYDCVKWCNARSLQAGLTQVYYLDSNFLFPYFSGDVDVVYADTAANGYRLPTEAEWEKAARGGLSEQRFPWGMVINENLANYYNSPGAFSYDLGGNTQNAVTPVGVYPPNGYGLYDMEGNVAVWCWDWYAGPSYPAGSPYLGGTNPQGASAGTLRVTRGCGFQDFANIARCARRSGNPPGYVPPGPVFNNYGGNELGFRCVRSH